MAEAMPDARRSEPGSHGLGSSGLTATTEFVGELEWRRNKVSLGPFVAKKVERPNPIRLKVPLDFNRAANAQRTLVST